MRCLHSEKKPHMLILENVTWWKYRNTERKGEKNTGGILGILVGHCYCSIKYWNIYRPEPLIKTRMKPGDSHGWDSTQRPLAVVQNQTRSQQRQSSWWLLPRQGKREQSAVRLQMDISTNHSPGWKDQTWNKTGASSQTERSGSHLTKLWDRSADASDAR